MTHEPTDPDATNTPARPGTDHHTTNTPDHEPESTPHSPEPPQTISAPRRLTITIPGDEAEACQFTNGVIMAYWADPPTPYIWRDLDALREQWPDAELTWLYDETAPPASVFIAEVIWFSENPVDGRRRVAVRASLDDALRTLREHETHGGDLVATETTSALGSKTARTWAVHERGTEPDDEGHLWITEEPIRAEARHA